MKTYGKKFEICLLSLCLEQTKRHDVTKKITNNLTKIEIIDTDFTAEVIVVIVTTFM